MAKIKILVGSVYGNALETAEQLQPTLEEAGHDVELLEEPAFADVAADDYEAALICASTTGAGELPGNIEPLYYELRDRFPMLPHLRYGVVALGDSSYGDTFCGGGKQLDELFAELGASKVGDRLEVDFGEHAEAIEVARPWAKAWATRL